MLPFMNIFSEESILSWMIKYVPQIWSNHFYTTPCLLSWCILYSKGQYYNLDSFFKSPAQKTILDCVKYRRWRIGISKEQGLSSYREKTAARAPTQLQFLNVGSDRITSAMTTSVLTSPGCEVIAAGGQLHRSHDANLDNRIEVILQQLACIARKLEI